jgi:hypothetical protein
LLYGRSVGIVRSLTKGHGVCFVFTLLYVDDVRGKLGDSFMDHPAKEEKNSIKIDN